MKTVIFPLILSVAFMAKSDNQADQIQAYKKSDHYDGKKFFNLVKVDTKSFWSVLKWRWTADRQEWPEKVENSAHPKLASALEPSEVVATFINHATYLFQFQSLNILVDPMFSDRTSPVSFAGPKRVRRPGLEFEQLPGIHYVLVTHNHYDHLDIESLKKLNEKFQPVFLVPLGNKKLLQSEGVSKVFEMDWWDEYHASQGLKIVLTPAQHWSARGLFDRFETLWGGFYISNHSIKIFWAGDTGYGPHFKSIREKLGIPDLSFLPIGAYEPRWFMKDMHMNPDDAVMAHLDLGTPLSIGMHFGTFQLTDEGIDDPKKALEIAKKAHAVESFYWLNEGETRHFNAAATTTKK